MKKKPYISTSQIVLTLLIARILFSSTYQSVLQAGNSVQDLLISVVAVFLISFVLGIPMLMLIKRFPEKGISDISFQTAGNFFGVSVSLLYFFYFIVNAGIITGNFGDYFSNAVIPDASVYLPGIFLIVVCLYGAAKGVEAIFRFGTVTFAVYILIFLLVIISVIPKVDMGLLKPLLYNGPSIMAKGIFIDFNVSIQIAAFSILAAFIKPGKNMSKAYCAWNTLSSFVFFVLEFFIVTVTGAFGAKNIYPLHVLAAVSQFSVFERLDSYDMISWIMNTILTVTLYIFLAVECISKAVFKNHRKSVIIFSGIIAYVISLYVSLNFEIIQSIMASGYYCLINTFFIAAIPLVILIIDSVKGKVTQNAKQ